MNETETLTREQFMKDLLVEWKSRKDQYSFLDFEGIEYNHWLEHRHGWPVTEDGHCGPSAALSLDDGGDPLPWEDCAVCWALMAEYERRGGTEPAYDEDKGPDAIECTDHADGSVSFSFPQGVKDLRFLPDSSGGFVLVLSKGEYDRWAKAHLTLLRKRAKASVRKEVSAVLEEFKAAFNRKK